MARFKWALLLIALSLPGLSAHAQLRPFTAVYAASYQGSEIGQGVFKLSLDQSHYHLELKIEPSGLLSIIPFSIHEQAQGIVNGHRAQPARYAYSRSRFGKTHQETVIFDTNGIQREAKGKRSALAYDPTISDPLSLILQIMLDLQQASLPNHYRVLNRGKIKDYLLQDQGAETLQTRLGRLPARRIQRSSGNRLIQFWFGSSVNFVPLRIIELREDREELSLTLRRLER